MYYQVLVASQRFHGSEALTYSSDEKLARGQVVQIPMQRQKIIGIVESEVEKPTFTTKSISFVWDIVIPDSSLKLLEWIQNYYPAPFGMLVELFTPPAMAKKLPAAKLGNKKHTPDVLPPLTTQQVETLGTIYKSQESSYLLHGQTGSGKTRVYLELIKNSFASGKSAILLTPEIGLTEPLIKQCQEQFGDQALVTHSGLTPAARRKIWLQMLNTDKPLVIIGPRSALFMPLKNIGVILVDEAHDLAYKQEQAPYYLASRVAAQLAQIHKAKVIFGSATPSLVDYFIFSQKNLPILTMNQQAIKTDSPVAIKIIDQTDRNNFSRSPYLATTLLQAVDTALSNGEQSLLFLNRRGSARVVLCENCGWQAICPHCDSSLTFHADSHKMRCHSCDFASLPPSICPDCTQSSLLYRSIGTKALETEIQRLFPGARIARFDRDTEKDERLHVMYDDLKSGKIDIIIGTQAIAKGFDLPNLSVVGIVNANSGLQIPDFTANERTFQLISQVSGRIGRGHRPGTLFVQSYQPDNNILKLALSKDYKGFSDSELAQRESFKFPPYYFLAKLTCLRTSSEAAQAACEKLYQDLSTTQGIILEGPAPRFVEKVANKHGWHIIVKAKDRRILANIAKKLPSNVICNLDPSNLL